MMPTEWGSKGNKSIGQSESLQLDLLVLKGWSKESKYAPWTKWQFLEMKILRSHIRPIESEMWEQGSAICFHKSSVDSDAHVVL